MQDTKYFRNVITKPMPFALDSTTCILMDILTDISITKSLPFSLCGGFVRNLLWEKPYNDFDICTVSPNIFRNHLRKMNVLRLAENEFDEYGVKNHDHFTNPFDFTETKHSIHFIETGCPNGLTPPSFDFTINEFSLKSDLSIYAPVYAWRDLHKKMLRMNTEHGKVTTNLMIRAVRFAALGGLRFEKGTKDLFHDRIEKAKRPGSSLDWYLLYLGMKKIIWDDVADEAFQIMRAMDFPYAFRYDKFTDYMAYIDSLSRTSFYRPENEGYHERAVRRPRRDNRAEEDMDIPF